MNCSYFITILCRFDDLQFVGGGMQVLLCVIRGVNDRMLWFYVDLCGQCVFWGVCAVGGAVTVEKWCG